MSMSVSHDRTTAISLRLANSDLATYSRRLWDEERCGLCVRQRKPYSVLIIPPGWYVRFSWAGAHQLSRRPPISARPEHGAAIVAEHPRAAAGPDEDAPAEKSEAAGELDRAVSLAPDPALLAGVARMGGEPSSHLEFPARRTPVGARGLAVELGPAGSAVERPYPTSGGGAKQAGRKDNGHADGPRLVFHFVSHPTSPLAPRGTRGVGRLRACAGSSSATTHH